MSKNPFLYFDFNQLRDENPNFTINQNLQIAISKFLLIRFQI